MTRRLATALVVGLAVAATIVSTAAAIRFTDDSCANDSGCRPPQGVVGASYFHKVSVSEGGGTGPYDFRVSSGALPPGLSLNSGNGQITGTPQTAGTYTFYLEAGDACPSSAACVDVGDPPPCLGSNVLVGSTCRFPHAAAQRDFTIVIVPGLRITTNTLPPTASVGVPYSATLEAQMVTSLNPLSATAAPPLTWSIVSGVGNGSPPGLTIGTGVISGTPTTEGAYTFRVQAAIDPTRTTFQTYSLTVRQPLKVTAPKPLATSPAPTVWEASVPFLAKLVGSGGSGTFTFTLAGGALPTGLALAADGTISGTARAAGIFRATVRLADSEGRTLDYAANFAVAPQLAITTAALRPGKVGRSYRVKLKTSGGIVPRTWRVVSGPLPKGVRLDRKLGVLSGIPRKPGSYRVRLEAKDGLKVIAQKTLRIVVLP